MVEAKDVIGGVAILGGLALGFMLLTKKSDTPLPDSGGSGGASPFDIGSFLGGNDTNPLLDFIKSAQEQQNTQGAPAGTKKAASLSDVNDYLTQYFGQPIASYAGSMGDIETLRPLPGYNQGAASRAIEAASVESGAGNFSIASGGVASIPSAYASNVPALQAAGLFGNPAPVPSGGSSSGGGSGYASGNYSGANATKKATSSPVAVNYTPAPPPGAIGQNANGSYIYGFSKK